MALNREVAFDMDDDILVMPNFVTRKQNSLIVIPSHAMIELLNKILTTSESLVNMLKPVIEESSGYIIEESSVREECMINHAEICMHGKSVNGRYKKFSNSYDKLILVSTFKTVSFWGLKMDL